MSGLANSWPLPLAGRWNIDRAASGDGGEQLQCPRKHFDSTNPFPEMVYEPSESSIVSSG
jgi:hypothetical protein